MSEARIEQGTEHAQGTGNAAQGTEIARREESVNARVAWREVLAEVELWHTPTGEAFATLPVDGHLEHWRLRQRAFRQWLGAWLLAQTGKGAWQAALDAVAALEGQAILAGSECQAFLRVGASDGNEPRPAIARKTLESEVVEEKLERRESAEEATEQPLAESQSREQAGAGAAQGKEKIYLDLCDRQWQAVEIDAQGWRIVSRPGVRFRRSKAMLPLAWPERGGSLAELRRFVSVRKQDWPLVLGWLVAALRPRGPYPILCLHGEQGSGKSTLARVLRALVDPNASPLRAEPGQARDLLIAAMHGWVVALDNLGQMPDWLSAALCRLSTGGGLSVRTLFEDEEETILDAQRPVILTGIDELATHNDLVDRALVLHLPTLETSKRRSEAQFWARFEAVRPRLLGALLDAASTALRRLKTTRVKGLPRMADFAHWAAAAEPALGLAEGEFLEAYRENREAVHGAALEASPIGQPIMDLAGTGDSWEGTAAELLEELQKQLTGRRPQGWPNGPRALASAVRRLMPNLRAIGITVEFWRENGNSRRRLLTIYRIDGTMQG